MQARHVTEQIDVDVPVHVAYNQWTQFEEFPRFMKDVESVKQIDDKHLQWRANVGGKTQEWTAEIYEQERDRRIAWRSVAGAQNAGVIDFEPLGSDRCRVRASIELRPDTTAEKIGSLFGIPQGAMRRDLERFKQFIESRGRETGAWRGDIPPEDIRTDMSTPGARRRP